MRYLTLIVLLLSVITASIVTAKEKVTGPIGRVIEVSNPKQVHAVRDEQRVKLKRRSKLFSFDLINTPNNESGQIKLGESIVSLRPASSVTVESYLANLDAAGKRSGPNEEVITVLKGTMRMATSIASESISNVKINAANVAQLAIKGTVVGVGVGKNKQGKTIAVGDVQRYQKAGKTRQSVIEITTPNGNKRTISSADAGEGGALYFKVDGDDIETSQTPFVLQSQVGAQLKEMALENADWPSYVNNYRKILEYNDVIYGPNGIGGTDADVVVNLDGLRDEFSNPEANVSQAFVSASGGYRLKGYFESQDALYESFLNGTNDTAAGNLPKVPYLDAGVVDNAQANNFFAAARSFSTTAQMLETPDLLEPFITDRAFLVDYDDTNGPASSMFLNTFKVNTDINTTVKDGTEIEYGSWQVPLENFSNQVILNPILSDAEGNGVDPGISESFITQSPAFYWISAETSAKPQGATYHFSNIGNNNSVVAATDSVYRSSTGIQPTIQGYITFDFNTGAHDGALEIKVPYDRELLDVATPDEVLWRVNTLSGATIESNPDVLGGFTLSDLDYEIDFGNGVKVGNTRHEDPFLGHVANFDGIIQAAPVGDSGNGLIGSYSFQTTNLFDSDDPANQNAVAGLFIGDNIADGAGVPSGHLQAQYDELKVDLTDIPDPLIFENGLIVSGDPGSITVNRVRAIDADDGIARDKYFLDAGLNGERQIIYNSNYFDNIAKQADMVNGTKVEMGVWNTNIRQTLNFAEFANDQFSTLSASNPSELVWITGQPTVNLPTSGSVEFNFDTAIGQGSVLGIDQFGGGVDLSPGAENAMTMHGKFDVDFGQGNHSISTTDLTIGVPFNAGGGNLGLDEWVVSGNGNFTQNGFVLDINNQGGEYKTTIFDANNNVQQVFTEDANGQIKGYFVGEDAKGIVGAMQLEANSGFNSVRNVFHGEGN